MDWSSKLRPQLIKNQCLSAKNIMVQDNASLNIVESSLDQFVTDNDLNSESFGALKQHMSDYKLILSSMRRANEEDIIDYDNLHSKVGDEELDGALILEQMEKAQLGEESARATAQYYRSIQYGSVYGNSKAYVSHYMPGLLEYYKDQSERYEQIADTWAGIYDECKRKEEKYDRIESETASLCLVGGLMRNDIIAGMNSFGVSGQYPEKGDALWRQKLQDANITATRRQLLADVGVTGKQLQNMENLGYLPIEVKAILESCKTEEDKVFFRYLMDENYISAFCVNPKYLSEGMTIALADYAWRMLELDENQKSTTESEKRLMSFNNALLEAVYLVNYDTELTPTIKYRDVYFEKLCQGTELLIQGDLTILVALDPNDTGYKELYADYEKKLRMKNLWMTEVNFMRNNEERGTYCKIKELSFNGETINFVFEHLRDWTTGFMEEERVKSEILDNGSALVNYGDRVQELKLKQELDQALEKCISNLVLDIGLAGLSVYAPGVALLASGVAGVVQDGFPGAEGLDSLFETKKGQLAAKAFYELTNNVVSGYMDFINTSSELEDHYWKIAQSWFGMGGVYTVLDENYEAKELNYNFMGQYDPNVLRVMNKWEKDGVAAWLPEELYKDQADENGKVDMDAIVKGVWEQIESDISISDKDKQNCEKLLHGDKGMFGEMNMGEFLSAVEAIESVQGVRSLDIKTTFSYVIDREVVNGL